MVRPEHRLEGKGILNGHWRRVGGGDGFSVMNDFSDPRFGYSMSQGGNLLRFDKITGAQKSIQPVHPDGEELRFNWNAGLTMDPRDSTTIYLGSQMVHRSSDHGASWDVLSPDLTTNDPAKQRAYESGGLTMDASGAEMHTTIIAIGPSPLEEGVIWVGTDDGNVQLTRDGGDSWTNLRDRIPGLPEGIWIPDVQPSRHVPGRAYLVAEDHRRGVWTSYVFVTEDYGRSWTSLATDGIDGFVHAVEEDPAVPDLLFLGTEFGLRVSLDRGKSWLKHTSGVPAVPVRDLRVHPRDGDLVLGTHGRGILIVDDIGPLREMASDPQIHRAGVHVFSPPPAWAVSVAEGIGYRSTGHAMQQGETRPYGALLSFWSGASGTAEVEIHDEDGELVFDRSVDASPGLNRVSWALRPGGSTDEVRFPRQMTALPGSYQVSVTVAGHAASAALEVRGDPRSPVPQQALLAQVDALRDMARLNRDVADARAQLTRASDGVEMVLETLPEDAQALAEQGRALRDTLAGASRRLFTGPECQGMCGGESLVDTVRRGGSGLGGAPGAPTANDRIMMEQARDAAETIRREIADLMNGPVARYREALRAAGYTPFDGVESDR